MMNLLANISLSLRWALRYIEWILIGEAILSVAFTGELAKPHVLLSTVVFSIVFFLLSLIFPIERPIWQRRVYVFIELGLAILAALLPIGGFRLAPLYLFKSCLFLHRKEVVLAALATEAAYMIGFVSWTLPQAIVEASARGVKHLPDSWQIVLGVFVNSTGANIFFVALGLLFVAERKSRQRAETLAQEVEVLAATLERNRIARNIHDSLGHTLTTLGIQLELVERLHQQDRERSLKSLVIAQQLTSQCLQEVRSALQTIRQPSFNLTQSILALVNQVKQNQSFTIEMELNLPQLPLQTSHQLYFIVQEGLTNIQKHARASRVVLQGQSTPNSIILELADNGRGFDPKRVHAGFGLKGMQERVQGLGGELTINSVLDQGTQIQVVIPQ